MFNFGIIDDDKYFVELLRNKLNMFLFDSETDYKIFTYNQATTFLNDYRVRKFDIVFLDIDMPDIDGISLAKQLRSIEYSPIIIFVTSKKSFMSSAFGVNVFSFLMKENLDEQLLPTLNECLQYISTHKNIILKTDKGLHSFYSDDIICIYSENRKINLITYLETYQIYQETLSSISEKLNNNHFIFANRGSIVNLKYVMNTKQGCISLLNTDHTESISRDKVKDFDKKLMDYILQQRLYK